MIAIAFSCDAQNFPTFKARSFEEMMAPFVAYRQHFDECANKINSLYEYLTKAEMFINKEDDPNTWEIYSVLHDAVIEEGNKLFENGTSMYTMRNINALSVKCRQFMNQLMAAYERRNRLAEAQSIRLRNERGLTCDQYYIEISIDEFLDGSTPTVNYQYSQQ